MAVPGRLVAPVTVHNGSTYNNHGCRCEECTAGHNAKIAAARLRRHKITARNGGVAPTKRHNVATYTNWRCRCPVCCDAWNTAARNRHSKEAAG